MKKSTFRNHAVMALLAVIGVLTVPHISRASEAKPFEDAPYREAVEAGKTVVLDFHADWCGTCRKQAKSLTEVLAEDAFKDVIAFRVNFDNAKALKQELGVRSQSTIIVFKGGAEVTRSTGETSVVALRELVKKGV